MRDIGKNVRDAREEKGLTQEELAEKLFVTRQTVSNYETGKTRPDVEMISKIASVLEIDANAVFYGLPDSEERHAEKRRLLIFGAVLAALVLAALPLHAWALKMQTERYQVVPNALMSLVYDPVLFFLLGLFALALVRYLLRAKPLDKPWVRWMRRAVLALLVLTAVLFAPLLLQIAGLPLPFLAPRPLQYFMLFVMEHPALYALPGGLLGLLGFPGKRETAN